MKTTNEFNIIAKIGTKSWIYHSKMQISNKIRNIVHVTTDLNPEDSIKICFKKF